MPRDSVQRKFFGKTWIFLVQTVIFGGLSAFSLILGPLFYTGALKDANNKDATDAGIALTIFGILFIPIFSLALFNIISRRRPLIGIYREGIEFNIIGASALNRVPFIPAIIRLAWLIVSLKGFRSQVRRTPWACYKNICISGMPLSRTLTIVADIFPDDAVEFMPMQAVAQQIRFGEVAFSDALNQIAAAIQIHASDVYLRKTADSWNTR
jgi:hypothetical protein